MAEFTAIQMERAQAAFYRVRKNARLRRQTLRGDESDYLSPDEQDLETVRLYINQLRGREVVR